MLPIRSFTLATWLRATLAGLVPPDDMVSAVRAAGGGGIVTGVVVPPADVRVALLELPAALRPARPEAARPAPPEAARPAPPEAARPAPPVAITLALPVAGDPLGLAGPGPFNEIALDAGEAVVVHLATRHAYGLVPTAHGWESYDAAIPHLPSFPEAHRDYRIALAEVRPEDVVSQPPHGRPAVPSPAPPRLPPGTESRRSAALDGPWQLLAALDGASSVLDDRVRTRLRRLDAAARRAVAAIASDSLGVR